MPDDSRHWKVRPVEVKVRYEREYLGEREWTIRLVDAATDETLFEVHETPGTRVADFPTWVKELLAGRLAGGAISYRAFGPRGRA